MERAEGGQGWLETPSLWRGSWVNSPPSRENDPAGRGVKNRGVSIGAAPGVSYQSSVAKMTGLSQPLRSFIFPLSRPGSVPCTFWAVQTGSGPRAPQHHGSLSLSSLVLFGPCTGGPIMQNTWKCLPWSLFHMFEGPAPSPRLRAWPTAWCPRLSFRGGLRCRLSGGYLRGSPLPSLGPGGGQTFSVAWVGSQPSWRGSRQRGRLWRHTSGLCIEDTGNYATSHAAGSARYESPPQADSSRRALSRQARRCCHLAGVQGSTVSPQNPCLPGTSERDLTCAQSLQKSLGKVRAYWVRWVLEPVTGVLKEGRTHRERAS